MSLLRQSAKAFFAVADFATSAPKGPRLLIYHRVGITTGQQMELSVEDFVWQLDWLKTNREVVDLETAVMRWNESEADNLVVLTFDDGYEDTYTTAYPLVRERGFPFTLYVSTEMLESECQSTRVRSLTWEQVQEMLDSGLLTLGAHTHTHRDLRSCGYEEIRYELDVSNDIIKHRTGIFPRHFAYPWGYWTEQAHHVVTQTYETATLGAPLFEKGFDAHKIFRFPVQLSDGRRWFPHRIRGGLLMEEWVRRRLRG